MRTPMLSNKPIDSYVPSWGEYNLHQKIKKQQPIDTPSQADELLDNLDWEVNKLSHIASSTGDGSDETAEQIRLVMSLIQKAHEDGAREALGTINLGMLNMPSIEEMDKQSNDSWRDFVIQYFFNIDLVKGDIGQHLAELTKSKKES